MPTDCKWVGIHFYTKKKVDVNSKVDGKIRKKPSWTARATLWLRLVSSDCSRIRMKRDISVVRSVQVSKLSIVGETQPRQFSIFNAVINHLDVLQCCCYLVPRSWVTQWTSPRAIKGRRAPLSADVDESVKIMQNWENLKNAIVDNFWSTAAKVLNPRFVCLESWSLQSMSISAWSTISKVVNFGVLFSGFSLHHLFLHMKYLWPPFGSARYRVLQVMIFGF